MFYALICILKVLNMEFNLYIGCKMYVITFDKNLEVNVTQC